MKDRVILRVYGGTLVLCASLLVFPAQGNASSQSQVEFHVNRVEYSSLDIESVRDFVYREFLESGSSLKYGRAVLEMPALNRGSSYLLVNLLHREDYGMSHARIDLLDGKVSKAIRDYVPEDDEYYDATRPGVCPDPEMRVVWGMAKVGRRNPAAVKAMKQAEDAVKKTKLKYKYLTQRETTTQNYKDWLACPRVTYFGSISHGSPRGFQLEDGTLGSRYFKSQAGAESFKCRTMWMTACEAHNNPLLGSIRGTGTSYYVSGIRVISFGTGDRTHGCFWETIFADEGSISVEQATKDCADKHYGGWPAVYGMTKQGVEPWECEPEVEPENPEGAESEGESTGSEETGGEDTGAETEGDKSEEGSPEPDSSIPGEDDESVKSEGNSDDASPKSSEDDDDASSKSDDEESDAESDESSEDDDEDESSSDKDADEDSENKASGCAVSGSGSGAGFGLLLPLLLTSLRRSRLGKGGSRG